MKNNKNIMLILDKSGSMSKRRDRTISDYNEYISSIPVENVNLALFTFNSKVQRAEDAREFLSTATYVPSGNTALFDAVAKAIYSVPEGETALVVILSDGEENFSRYQKGTGLATLIADKKKDGWEFLFVGCEDVCIKDADILNLQYTSYIPTIWTKPLDETWQIGSSPLQRHKAYCMTMNYLNS